MTLRRIPGVRDIRTMQRLLVDIGSTVEAEGDTVRLHTPRIVCPEAPYELVKTMRASSSRAGASGSAQQVLPAFLCRAVAALARVPSTCTFSAWSNWVRALLKRTATSRRPRRKVFAVRW